MSDANAVSNSPSLVLPSSRQLRHHAREFYGFVHFTTNTFTDREWGFGDEQPGIFDPSAFDASQIADSAKLAGMRGLILTCKHHDGFCLWPSGFTSHSVAATRFRRGRGDVVREVERACRAAGLEFGVYLSPWDRNHAGYGTPAYVNYYRSQLRELLTQYGDLFEVWFDGANGGDGYYGGANEHRSIDNRTYYGWEQTWALVRELQPQSVIFSDVGPDVRWVGNEAGVAGDPCWYTMDTADAWPGHANTKQLNRGTRGSGQWLIPECDVSIRPGWFYHAAEDDAVRSPENLVDLYVKSVGRGATFLLNLPPDRRGLVPERDRASLRGFRSHLDATFSTNLARDGRCERSADGRSIAVYFSSPQRFNVVELREHIDQGQRIFRWKVEVDERGDGAMWRSLVEAEAVGARRFARVPASTARAVRVRVLESNGLPLLKDLGLYLEPAVADAPPVAIEGPALAQIPARVVRANHDEIVLDLGTPHSIRGIRYTPDEAHRVSRYAIAWADILEAWLPVEIEGEFGNVQFNTAPQTVAIPATVTRFVRFRAAHFVAGDTVSPDAVQVLG